MNNPSYIRSPQRKPEYTIDLDVMYGGSKQSATWAVVASAVVLVFVLMVWCFFYKLIVGNTPTCSKVPWYGFAILLFVFSTIYVVLAFASLITSSIHLSAQNKKKCN
jgi:hypothetical protein